MAAAKPVPRPEVGTVEEDLIARAAGSGSGVAGFGSVGAARTGVKNLPKVSHVNQGHEGVSPVGVQPEILDPVVTHRDKLAVVDA